MSGLYMAVPAPIEFALQHAVAQVGQVLGNGGDAPGGPRPVLPANAVAPADGLGQPTLVIDQGNGYAIHLGLDPEVLALAQPAMQVIDVAELVQSGLRYRVAGLAAVFHQGVAGCGRRFWKAAAQSLQSGAGLVVEFVVDVRAARLVVSLVPFGDLPVEGRQFRLGTASRPVGAAIGQGGEGEAEGGQGNPAVHGEPPCSLGRRPL
ncbi:hypothetical protein D9M68_642830 [compost metagenome]